MSARGAAAELAAFKIVYPLWAVIRAGIDLRAFEASRAGVTVRGKTLGELAQRIGETEAAWPS